MEQYIAQHGWLFYMIAIFLAGVVAFFIKRIADSCVSAIDKVGESVSDLYDKYNDHEHRLSSIEGEHKIFTTFKKGHGVK